MHLPKSLLGAILAGITIQAATSCQETKTPAVKEVKKDSIKAKTDTARVQPPADGCPACGMG